MLHAAVVSQVVQRRRHGRGAEGDVLVAAAPAAQAAVGVACKGYTSANGRAADSAGTSLQRLYYQQRGYTPR